MTTPAVAMVREAWHRLETWCRQRHPALLDTLNPGATDEEIASLEQTIGQQLSDDVRESLAIHNGQPNYSVEGLLFGKDLLDIEEIKNQWSVWSELLEYNDDYRENMESHPKEAIQLDYANLGWIPVSNDSGGNHLGVDLSPGAAGSIG